MTVFHEDLHARVDVLVGQIDMLQNAVRVLGKCENRAFSADVGVGQVQTRERRDPCEGHRDRPRTLNAIVS